MLQEFQGAQQEQEKEQQQREHMESERSFLLQKLKEAEQEQEQEQQLRAIESEKRMLRNATNQLEEDLMDQGHQSMCVTSTTVLGVGASCYDLAGLQAETP